MGVRPDHRKIRSPPIEQPIRLEEIGRAGDAITGGVTDFQQAATGGRLPHGKDQERTVAYEQDHAVDAAEITVDRFGGQIDRAIADINARRHDQPPREKAPAIASIASQTFCAACATGGVSPTPSVSV